MSAKIARSAKDATRFTSTIPHASSKTGADSASSSIPRSRMAGPVMAAAAAPRSTPVVGAGVPAGAGATPGGGGKGPGGFGGPGGTVRKVAKGETPQEKVKRLRAALEKSRAAQETMTERLILRGRVWADRAHRITTSILILMSVIGFVVTLYAFVDMASHNRRKKAEYFAEKKAAYAAGLIVSREAIARGTANQAQIDLVAYDDAETARQEQLRVAEEEKLLQRKDGWGGLGGWWRGVRDVFFGGLKSVDDVGLHEDVDRLMQEIMPKAEKEKKKKGVLHTDAKEASVEVEVESAVGGIDGKGSLDSAHRERPALSGTGAEREPDSSTSPASSSWFKWR